MCLVEILPPPGRPALALAVLEWDATKGEYVDQKKPETPAGVSDGRDRGPRGQE